MLKFTKYGRSASAGNFTISSSRKEKSAVMLTSFTEVSAKGSAEKIQCSQPDKSKPVNMKASEPTQLSVDQQDSKMHLQRSKVSKEELLKLDAEDFKRAAKRVEPGTNQFYPKRIDSLVSERNHKAQHLKKCTSTSFCGTGNVKVPVYNDGYFPKVPPLSKFFVVKQPDSKEVSAINTNTHR